jgi:aminopeptidase N
VNTLRPAIEYNENDVITSFAVLQEAPLDYPTIRPHRLAIGFYTRENNKLVRSYRVELDVDGERTEVPELVGRERPALVLLNDDDLAYAKIRLDAYSLDTSIDDLAAIESPLARSLVWGSVWDSTRDAETRGRDFVRLVLGNIATETESTTIRTVLGQLVLTATQYVAPDAREETVQTAADALWRLALDAAPGSDAQFQFVKFFAALAGTEEQLENVAHLHDGTVVLDGLDIDTDLTWELLISLVAGGKAGQAEIDATLAADNTASGQQSAAHARAAIPTPEGKAAAFSSLVDDDKAPNAIVRATGLGFQRAADPALFEPLVPRYFESLQRLWETRSYAIAASVINGLYPSSLANQQLRDATQAWLDAPENAGIPALRRLVIENLAGVDRALAAQARDAR